jgi:flagellar basal body-associated protein FliL
VATTWNSEDSFWKRTIVYSAVAVALVAAGGAYYYFHYVKGAAPTEVTAPVAQAPVSPPADTTTDHHQLPEAASADGKSLPSLNESDPAITDALAGFFGKKTIEQMLVPEQVIRHIVVTVDNLPRKKVAADMRPVKPTGGETLVSANGDMIMLSASNSARYAAFMKMVEHTDTKQLGALYIRFYPLFQQSYEDLGYPGQYFNDRLVQVIDDLLKTPEVRGPLELKQGHVFYEYADPALEGRSAGQKLLLRMGSDNSAAIKKKLRELREVVTTSQDPPADSNAATPPPAATPDSTAAAPAVIPDTTPSATPAPR